MQEALRRKRERLQAESPEDIMGMGLVRSF